MTSSWAARFVNLEFIGFVTATPECDRNNARFGLFPRQFLLDCRNQTRIVRFSRRGKSRLQTAVAADQIFMEIPTRCLERPFLGRPFVEWVGVRALDCDLFGEREGDM